MATIDSQRLAAAERFIWCNARLLERLRFEHLFRGGDADRVVAALRPYQNPDGGFGGALEPDFRGPVSQGSTLESALKILDEVDRADADIVQPACDWLMTVTTAEGGVPMVLASAAEYPRAPWWNPAPEASILPTGGIAGLLHAHGVDHPWLGPATEFCWRALDAIPERVARGDFLIQVAYDVRSALLFLDHVPDRARAEEVCAGVGRLLIDSGVIALDPATPGEVAMPLEFAAHPSTLARGWFEDATIDAHLDTLVATQQDDGGWPVNWQIWTEVTGPEWRGWQTVERLKTLQAYGRLKGQTDGGASEVSETASS
jgi:hypothetical protein